MKFPILFTAALITFNTFGQSDDTVHYSMVENNPNKSFFAIGPSYDVLVGKFNTSAAAVGGGVTVFTPVFSGSLGGRYHFGESLTDDFAGDPYARSVYEYEPSRSINFDGTYYFTNDLLNHNATVKLYRSGDVEYVVSVPCKYSKRLGIDIGFSGGVYYYNFGQKGAVAGIGADNNEVPLVVQGERTVSTFYSYKMLKLGFSRTLVDHVIIQTEKYGKKSSKTVSKLYADLLFAFGTDLDDVLVPYIIDDNGFGPSGPYMQYDIRTSAKMLPVGFCTGWNIYNIGKHMGIGAKLELGLLPGPHTSVANNLYFNLGMRFEFLKFIN